MVEHRAQSQGAHLSPPEPRSDLGDDGVNFWVPLGSVLGPLAGTSEN
jgi:hypothetical protein